MKQDSYNKFLLSAKMTYKLSSQIIERRIAEPEKTIAIDYFVYYQWLYFLVCNFLVFLLDKWSYLTTEFLFVNLITFDTLN